MSDQFYVMSINGKKADKVAVRLEGLESVRPLFQAKNKKLIVPFVNEVLGRTDIQVLHGLSCTRDTRGFPEVVVPRHLLAEFEAPPQGALDKGPWNPPLGHSLGTSITDGMLLPSMPHESIQRSEAAGAVSGMTRDAPLRESIMQEISERHPLVEPEPARIMDTFPSLYDFTAPPEPPDKDGEGLWMAAPTDQPTINLGPFDTCEDETPLAALARQQILMSGKRHGRPIDLPSGGIIYAAEEYRRPIPQVTANGGHDHSKCRAFEYKEGKLLFCGALYQRWSNGDWVNRHTWEEEEE